MSPAGSETTAQYGGWLIAAGLSVWLWVSKLIMKRHLEKWDAVVGQLNEIDARLNRIEGRFLERDHWEEQR